MSTAAPFIQPHSVENDKISIVNYIHMRNTHARTIKEPHLPYKTKSPQCTGRVSANTRPHQLCWGDMHNVMLSVCLMHVFNIVDMVLCEGGNLRK